MILKQHYLGCLAHASYFVADEATRSAVVIDPQRDVEQYLEDAAQAGVEIRHVLLTHFHADFVAGHLELRARTGARIGLGAAAAADYEFTPLRDGDRIEMGRLRLTVLETPGHTPESVCYLLHDLDRSETVPHAVFTGDTLFVGDVGRPDLMASVGVSAEELAAMLYDSLRDKLLPLPDSTLLYPAHGAGSACGKNLGSESFSTIGAQRLGNHALQPMTKEAFVALVTSGLPSVPRYFSYDAALNRREHPTLDESLRRSLVALSLDDVLRRAGEGATVLDARDPAAFAEGHLRGSVNVGLGGKYATWAGSLLDRSKPIVLVAEPGKETEAAMRLGRIGFDDVVGYLEGGAAAFRDRPDVVAQVARTTAPEVAERLASSRPPLVVDVRTPREWQQARIGDSLNVPLDGLEGRLGEIPRDRPFVVHCQSGYRSSIAASLLLRHGVSEFADLVGGIEAWNAALAPSPPSALRS